MTPFSTQIMPVSAAAIQHAALLLSRGEVVAFPTETVYGLGANALDEGAVRRIFDAKGRPSDNPLIVHIAERSGLQPLVSLVPPEAEPLMRAFWPGPLTLILPKSARVPEVVTAGLDTVAVRMPAHEAARALIRAAGVPIAAPSANRSGRPSPTAARHVFEDMDGRIPLILDGGACRWGVESTVLDLTADPPVLLRPGGVTLEALRLHLPNLRVDSAVLSPLDAGAQARSPGLKHRHYAPDARVLVVRGDPAAVRAKIASLYDEAQANDVRAAILCPSRFAPLYGDRNVLPLGGDESEMAAHLFETLRALDRQGFSLALAEAAATEGMGLALMNRLLRAADFEWIGADMAP